MTRGDVCTLHMGYGFTSSYKSLQHARTHACVVTTHAGCRLTKSNDGSCGAGPEFFFHRAVYCMRRPAKFLKDEKYIMHLLLVFSNPILSRIDLLDRNICPGSQRSELKDVICLHKVSVKYALTGVKKCFRIRRSGRKP